jgi:hypothetical protein
MELQILVPEVCTAPLEEVVARLSAPQSPILPFSEPVIDFCAGFSAAIFRDREASRYPELASLAFWMRKAELLRLRSEFAKLARPDTVAVPRGLVFHIPPGNVDTIFIYSWLLAALTGNRNVIRMSSRRAPQSDILLRLWRESLAQAAPELAQSTVVVSYAHSDEVTRALSLVCDVRVIWGGDQTVTAVRTAPLAPHARELTFTDRASLAVLHAGRYSELDEAGRAKLADRFFNDAYWFDQMACSSPRLVVWVGAAGAAARADAAFWDALAACIGRKGFASPAAVHMRKLVFACQAVVDLPVSRYRRDPEAAILHLDNLAPLPREHSGGGLFFTARVDDLNDVVPALQRHYQTLTHFGFDNAELRGLAVRFCGRAIDRMVPVGQALQFNRFWDGYDLLHEFCRLTYFESQNGAVVPADGTPPSPAPARS